MTEEPGELYSPWGHKESDTTEWLTLPLYKFTICELKRNLGIGLETQLSLTRLFLWEKYVLPTPSRTHNICFTHSLQNSQYMYHNPLILKPSCGYYTDLCALTFMSAVGVASNFWLKAKQKSVSIALNWEKNLRILVKLLFSWIGGYYIKSTFPNIFNVIQNDIHTF